VALLFVDERDRDALAAAAAVSASSDTIRTRGLWARSGHDRVIVSESIHPSGVDEGETPADP
jgi:hypothetical protein